MVKNDIILIILILSCAFCLIIMSLVNKTPPQRALVYYDNNLIKTIDLKVGLNQEYKIKGYNGEIVLETNNNMIRVKKENSPLHLCSKQGWVKASHDVIVCLPNRVVIKIEGSKPEVDVVVR